ncbi:MAG: HpsJ family protein [Elainella sp.]
MTSKKLSSSRSVPALVANILKIVGLIITLAALLDILVLPMPYQFGDQQWQIDFVTSVVDRGIVPLVGIVLFLTGFSLDESEPRQRPLWQDPRFWALLLASILGLVYVLAFPFHLNNVRLANQAAIQQVNDQAKEAETQLNQRLTTEIESRRQQINQLLTATDAQISQLVQNNQLTQEQANLVKGFKTNPNSVEPFLKKQEDELRTQLQTEIGTRKQQAQDSRKTTDLKSGLRVGIGSLLLAVGFITLGWTGLRNVRQLG